MKNNQKTRKKKILSALNLVWILINAGCVIYLGRYYYQSIHNKEQSKKLASSVELLRQEVIASKNDGEQKEEEQAEAEQIEKTQIEEQTGKENAKFNQSKKDNADKENTDKDKTVDYFASLTATQKKELILPAMQMMYGAYSKTLGQSVRMLPQYQQLYLENPDLAGWIRIPDTLIDYPVMQAEDNSYYLDKGIDKKYLRCGSIFADAKDNVFWPSDNVILYGHNMKDGTMFHSLINYAKEEYYQEHRIILFDTVYQEHTYEVVAAFYTKIYDKDSTEFKYYQFHEAANEQEFDDFIQNIKKLSEYDTKITPVYGDHLITLSTCAYHTENGRFVVVARRIDRRNQEKHYSDSN